MNSPDRTFDRRCVLGVVLTVSNMSSVGVTIVVMSNICERTRFKYERDAQMVKSEIGLTPK